MYINGRQRLKSFFLHFLLAKLSNKNSTCFKLRKLEVFSDNELFMLWSIKHLKISYTLQLRKLHVWRVKKI